MTFGIIGSMGLGNLNDGKAEIDGMIHQLRGKLQVADDGEKKEIEEKIQGLIKQAGIVNQGSWF